LRRAAATSPDTSEVDVGQGASGVAGNEMARETGLVGAAMQEPEIATPAGIRKAYPI